MKIFWTVFFLEILQMNMYIVTFVRSHIAGDMLDLLKWRTHPDRIMDCLSKLKDTDGTEIVKVKKFYLIIYYTSFC